MSNLSGRGQLTGIIRNGSGGGGGSEVIINPSGTPIGIMEKISVDGEVYEVRNVPDATSASNGDVLTRSASGVGWYPPTKELPVFTSGDNNKVLSINNNTLSWETIPKELPSIISSDEGKVLGISNGTPVWLTPSGGGGISYSTNEVLIGTWIDGTNLYERTFSINTTLTHNNDWEPLIDSDFVIKDLIESNFNYVTNAGQNGSNDSTIIRIAWNPAIYPSRLCYYLSSGVTLTTLNLTLRYTKVGE